MKVVTKASHWYVNRHLDPSLWGDQCNYRLEIMILNFDYIPVIQTHSVATDKHWSILILIIGSGSSIANNLLEWIRAGLFIRFQSDEDRLIDFKQLSRVSGPGTKTHTAELKTGSNSAMILQTWSLPSTKFTKIQYNITVCSLFIKVYFQCPSHDIGLHIFFPNYINKLSKEIHDTVKFK